MSTSCEQTVRNIFNLYDKDNSGKISQNELQSVMTSLGLKIDSTQLAKCVEQYDTNNDGEWDFDEFYSFYVKVVQNPTSTLSLQQEIDAVFSLLDADKNGKIDVSELSNFMETLGCHLDQEVLLQVISMYDQDKSGLMEYKEFSVFYTEVKTKTGAFAES